MFALRTRPCAPFRGARRGVAAALAALVLVAAGSWVEAASRNYRNAASRIDAFEVPRGWTLAPQLPWPGLLLLANGTRAAGSEGARLVLAVQRVVPGQDALGLAADARAALIKQGFEEVWVAERTGVGGVEQASQLEAGFDRRRQSLRQVYVVSGDIALILTLTAPPAVWPRAVREFEAAIGTLDIASPAAPAAPPDGSVAPPRESAPRDGSSG